MRELTDAADNISVVIPAYNAAAYLGEAVRSVCEQTLPPCRIIIVDDGSTDATPDVAADLQRAGLGLEIEYLRQENGGPGSAMNHGAALIEHGLIAFQAADDIWVPERPAGSCRPWPMARTLSLATARISSVPSWTPRPPPRCIARRNRCHANSPVSC